MSAPDQGRAAARALFIEAAHFGYNLVFELAEIPEYRRGQIEAEADRRSPALASTFAPAPVEVPAPAVPLHLRPVTQEWMAGGTV